MEINNNRQWREFWYEVNVYIPSSTLNRIRDDMSGSWGANRAFFLLNEMTHRNPTNASPSSVRKSSVLLNIRRESQGSPFRWGLTARDTKVPDVDDWRVQWTRVNSTATVPVNQWFKLEFYLKEGGNASEGAGAGRVFAAMIVNGTKTVLFNITGPTRALNFDNSRSGYSGVSPLKLYVNKPIIEAVNSDPVTSPNPVSVYWDNFRIYYGAYPYYMSTNATYDSDRPASVGFIPWVSSGPYLTAPSGDTTTGEFDYR